MLGSAKEKIPPPSAKGELHPENTQEVAVRVLPSKNMPPPTIAVAVHPVKVQESRTTAVPEEQIPPPERDAEHPENTQEVAVRLPPLEVIPPLKTAKNELQSLRVIFSISKDTKPRKISYPF